MIPIVDDDKPAFVQDLSDTVAYANTTFKFSLLASDNIEPLTAAVEFYFGTSGTHKFLTLTKDGNYFNGSIKLPQSTETLNYRFLFNDSNPSNDELTTYFQVNLIDNEDPQWRSGSGHIQATTGEAFSVFAKFSDNIGISEVTLYYKKSSAGTWEPPVVVTIGSNEKYMKSNSDLIIDTTNDDTDYEYYFSAVDTSANSVTYGTEAERAVLLRRADQRTIGRFA